MDKANPSRLQKLTNTLTSSVAKMLGSGTTAEPSSDPQNLPTPGEFARQLIAEGKTPVSFRLVNRKQ